MYARTPTPCAEWPGLRDGPSASATLRRELRGTCVLGPHWPSAWRKLTSSARSWYSSCKRSNSEAVTSRCAVACDCMRGCLCARTCVCMRLRVHARVCSGLQHCATAPSGARRNTPNSAAKSLQAQPPLAAASAPLARARKPAQMRALRGLGQPWARASSCPCCWASTPAALRPTPVTRAQA